MEMCVWWEATEREEDVLRCAITMRRGEQSVTIAGQERTLELSVHSWDTYDQVIGV